MQVKRFGVSLENELLDELDRPIEAVRFESSTFVGQTG